MKKYLVFLSLLIGTMAIFPQSHFQPVLPSGLPYHIILDTLLVDGQLAKNGIEVGVFDGSLCVGSYLYTQDNQTNVDIVTWKGDASLGLAGFNDGDTITYKVWFNAYGDMLEKDAVAVYKNNSGKFSDGTFSVVKLIVETNLSPVIIFSPSILNFGNIVVGESLVKQVIIKNQGNANLQISKLEVDNSQFQVQNAFYFIQPNDSAIVSVTFRPINALPVDGKLIVSTNLLSDSEVSFNLFGQGIPTGKPLIRVSESALTFGFTPVTKAKTLNLQIFNDGSLKLDIYNCVVSSSVFKIVETAFSILPGDSKSLKVEYIPTNAVTNNATLSFYNNTQNQSPYTIQLSGNGFIPYFSPVEPTGEQHTIVIDEVVVDEHSLSIGDEIAVYDGPKCVGREVFAGNLPLTISAWEALPEYNKDGYNEGDSITLKIWGTTFGTQVELIPNLSWLEGSKTFTKNGFSSVKLSILSKYEPVIITDKKSMDFGLVPLQSSMTDTLVITNSGKTNLIINEVTSTNGDFLVSFTSAVIPANSSKKLFVTFFPKSVVWLNGTITLKSNDPRNPLISVEVTGSGRQEDYSFLIYSNSPIDFGIVAKNDSAQAEISFQNAGTTVITFYSIQSSDGSLVLPTTSFVVNPNQIVNYRVSFKPKTVQMFSGTLRFRNTSQNASTIDIKFSGRSYNNYFNKVLSTGLPYKFVLDTVTSDAGLNLSYNEELGVFDGSICVGSTMLTNDSTKNSITAWQKNAHENLSGFEPGNQSVFKMYNDKTVPHQIHKVEIESIIGDGTFGFSPYSVLKLKVLNQIYAPETPLLKFPLNRTLDQALQIHLSWNKSFFAKNYRLQIGKDSLFTQITFDDNSLTDTTLAVLLQSYETRYFWRVTAINSGGISEWSEVRTFKTIIEVPTTPVAQKGLDIYCPGQEVLFTWQKSERAEKYILQISESSSFTSFYSQDTVLSSNLSVTRHFANTKKTFFWRVVAINVGGSSGYSQVYSFATLLEPNIPLAISPAKNSLDLLPDSVSFTWSVENSNCNLSHWLQVTEDTLSASNVVNDSVITSWTYTLKNLKYLTTYFWRVRAKNTYGWGSFNSWNSFKTIIEKPSAPNLVFPSQNAVNVKPPITLRWFKADRGEKYTVQISEDEKFTSFFKNDSTVTDTSVAVNSLSDSVTYFWRVLAANNGGKSSFSTIFKFTTRPKAILALLSPNGGENFVVGKTDTVSWFSSNIDDVKLDYSTNNGTNWISILSSTPASSGSYVWTFPNTPSTNCKVRITDVSNNSVVDISDNIFEIVQPKATVLKPNGGEIFVFGKTDTIKWSSSNITDVKLDYTTDSGTNWISILSSTPASSGRYVWTIPNTLSANCKVKVSDASNNLFADSSDNVFTIVQPKLTVLKPNGGDAFVFGKTDTIKWSSSNVTNVKLEYTTNGGTNWISILETMHAGTGSYVWTVPNTLSANCKVRVSDVSNDLFADTSDNVFAIVQPKVTLIKPNGGEAFVVGKTDSIKWICSNILDVKLEYSTNNGADWISIVASTQASTSSYPWTIPNTLSNNCIVRVSDVTNNVYTDTSDNVFSIITLKVTVIKPNGGENFVVGKADTIKWSSLNVTNVKLEYTTNNGINWISIIAATPASAGSYVWTIPNTPSTNCKLRISDVADTSVTNTSDNFFAIVLPEATVLKPNGGEIFVVGKTDTINWSSSNISNLKLEYTTNSGTNWISILTTTPANVGNYIWTIPNTPSTKCKVKITDVLNNAYADTSDNFFTIIQPKVTVLKPNSGEKFIVGKIDTIKWSSSNVTNVKLEYTTDNGANWISILTTTPASIGSYVWTVPNTPSTSCKVKISDVSNNSFADTSDNVFSIIIVNVTVLKPNGGENFAVGKTDTIKWSSSNVANVKLEYTTDNGANWISILTTTPASIGSYVWTIPNTVSNQCKIRISDSDNSTLFDETNDPFSILEYFVEQTAISLAGVYSSSVAWGDYNNDGNLDILLCGLTSTTRFTKIYKNNGDNTFTEQTSISLPGVYNCSAAWGDYNNDGFIDILLTGIDNSNNGMSKIYKNNGNGTFTEQTSISLTGIKFSSAAWGDCDNDGDLDILLSGLANTERITMIYRNNGNNTFTEQTSISLAGVDGSSDWGDYDNDGDLDILLTGLDNNNFYVSKIYKNNGDGTLTEQTSISLTGVKFSSAAWGDYDSDGDLDILLSGWSLGGAVTKVYKNNGDGTFAEQNSFLIKGAFGGSVTWGDYDNDGFLDFLVTGKDVSNNGVSKIYRNTGNGSFIELTSILPTTMYPNSVAVGDYDNDGDIDILLTGDVSSGPPISKIFKNNSSTVNTVPNAPTNLSSSVDGNVVTFNWNKSTDNQTPQNGLHYNLVIGTTANSINTLSPMANRTNGYRRVVRLGNSQTNSWTIKNLPIGTYYWSVQAIDNTFAGSTFANEKTFTIRDLVPPNAPQSLAAFAGNQETTLKWKKNSETDVSVYRIYGGTSANPSTKIDSVSYTDTTKSISNLTNGLTYYYRITAVDSSGNESGFSNEVSTTPASNASLALIRPNGGESFFAGTVDTIKWTSANIANIKLEYSTDGGINWSEIIASTSASSIGYTWTIPNTPSTQCKVRISDAGNSAMNDVSNAVFTILKPKPIEPKNLLASAVSKKVTLKWNKNTETDLRVYRIYGGTSANPITKIDSVSYTDTTKTIFNLTNGTTYYYRITAVDSIGNESGYSNEVIAIPKLNLVDNGDGTITDSDLGLMWLKDANYALTSGYDNDGKMTWDEAMLWADKLVFAGYDDWRLPTVDPSCGSGNASYNCARGEYAHLYYTELVYAPSAAGNWSPFINMGQSSGRYWSKTELSSTAAWVYIPSEGSQSAWLKTGPDGPYAAMAVRSISGSDTTAPSALITLTATPKDKTVTLTWEKNLERDVKVYRIYGGTSANPLTKIDSVNYTDTTKTIANLTNGTTYFYRITAVDSTGNESGYSNEVNATPVAPATLTLVRPNGDESFVAGTVDTIKWTITNVTNVKLKYTTNDGTNWVTIITSTPASSNHYAWLIPTVFSTTCKVRLSDVANSSVADTSDNVFTINYVNGYDSITYAGKIYHTVKIGNQTWLKENLDIGTMIQLNADAGNNGTIEKYCYDNNQTNCETYGGLYQWNEAMAYTKIAGTQGICPTAWHIPTITEIELLGVAISNNANVLKSEGQGGTNTSGFSALLAGYRSTFGNIDAFGNYATFWSSTDYIEPNARSIILTKSDSIITFSNGSKGSGFSIRCLKDESPTASIQITSPNGGESFVAGTVDTIEWTSTNVTNVKLEYTTNSGTNWSTIIASTPASSNRYFWLIPTVSSTNCKVRLSDVANSSVADTSDNVFTINYVNGYDSITYAGKIYHTVKIGTQTWLKENLDIGTMITGTVYQSDNGTIEKYCYNNDPANCITYGGLYKWNEAMQYVTIPGAQGICPTGWHIPTLPEFQTLGAVNNNSNTLKAVGQGTGSGAGINTSGFSALLAGGCSIGGNFGSLGGSANYWSSQENGPTRAYFLTMIVNDSGISLFTTSVVDGFSVRCLKDENPIASIQLISPNGGESFVAGTIDTIKWTSTVVTNVKLEYTTNSGTDWATIIASTPASSGSYAWTIPNIPSTQCQVKISDVDNASIADTSGIFTIAAPVQKITVTSPNGGERWKGNSSQQITWGVGSKQLADGCVQSAVGKAQKVIGQVSVVSDEVNSLSGKLKVKNGKLNLNTDNLELTTNNSIENVRIDYSTNNGSTWTTVASSVLASQNNYTWLVPKVNSQNCKIRVVDQIDITKADTSDAVFEIYSPQITVTSPNGGEQWQVGTSHAITWTQSNSDTVKISYSTNQGTGWIAIAEKPASAGTYAWIVPSTISTTCKVKINDKTDPTFADSSNAVFAITSTPVVVVISPNGGESFTAGTIDTIKWTSSNVTNAKLEYTTNSGTDWATIIASTPASSGSYTWLIPTVSSTTCKVRISDVTNSLLADTSDNVFTIKYVNGYDSITYGGKIYHTVKIGNQTWLKENLDIGTKIQDSQNAINNGVIEKYCLNNDANNCNIYGGLYQWNEAMQYVTTEGAQGICPTGWHIPTNAELQTLANAVGNNSNALKAIGQGAGTNTSGFSALFAGYRDNYGNFLSLSYLALYWSSTEYGAIYADGVSLDYDGSSIASGYPLKSFGYSVRCLKNEIPTASIQIISHNGGESFIAETVDTIRWTSTGVTNVKLEYTTNSGTNWATIIASTPASSNRYAWLIPTVSSTTCKVRLSDVANSSVADTSDNVFSIKTITGTDSLVYGGKIYHTVKIGTQTWLKENLDIGTMIDSLTNASNNGTIEKYCYNNNLTNCETYGGLYQWDEAMQYVITEKAKGICPTGWYIPTKAELETLKASVSNDGNALKAIGQGTSTGGHNGAGTNTSGFSALLAGYRDHDGIFYTMGYNSTFLSSTLQNATNSFGIDLYYYDNNVTFSGNLKEMGLSVRCLKDENPIATLQIISPNGGESLVAGTVDTIIWTSANVTNVKLEYTTNSGTNWSTIIASTPASLNRYAWLIPTVSSTTCKVRLSDVANSSVADTSDNVFAINYVNGYDSITYAGKIYHTVKIGNQTWLKENLDIGTMIQGNVNATNNGTIEKYCYDNNPANCDTYGGLYQWNEAMAYSTTPGTKGICPDGWLIPTSAEFDTLAVFENNDGNALKVVGQGTGTGVGTNTSGFSVLIAGGRDFDGNFLDLGSNTDFWSSTEFDATNANIMFLWFGSSDIYRSSYAKVVGFSIRCLKDENPTANIQIISPNGEESFVAGTVDTIKWTSTSVTNVKLEYSTNSGTNWTIIIASTPASSGSYPWTIPNTPSTQCKVKISDVDNASVFDTSGIFTITAPVQKITVTSPSGGERWKGNSSQQITWGVSGGKLAVGSQQSAVGIGQSAVGKGQKVSGQESVVSDEANGVSGNPPKAEKVKSGKLNLNTDNLELTTNNSIENVRIDYSTNNGVNWTTVANGVSAAQNSYTWLVPNVNSPTCKIRVVDQVDTTFADTSNAVFEIYSPQITVTSPNGGEQWQSGSSHAITWTQINTDTVKISYSTNQGTGWIAIAEKPASAGTYSWVVPSTISSACKVKINDKTDPTFADSSNAVFAITSIPVVQVLVTSPNGGENWKVGSAQNITWTSSNVSKFKIEYKINNAGSWTQVGYAATSPYSWTVPNTISTQCKVRISDSTNAAICDSSDAVFTIFKPTLTVVYPNGGEELQVGSNINVTWLSSNVQNVAIEYSTTNKRTWSTISASVAASNQSISWTVPDAVSDSCFIRIKDVSDNSVADTSDSKFKIIPSSPPSLTLTSPVGNEQWKLGTKHFITWTKNKVTTVKIEFSSNDGSSWSTLTSSAVADSGKYEWTVPNTAFAACRIKISDAGNPLLYSVSPLPFEIYYSEIVLTAPNGGEEWMVSETHAITWTSLHVNKVKVELTTDNGANWTVQKDSATASIENVTWVIPNIPATSTECKIRISDANDPTVSDVSEQVFTVKGLPKLQVISPKAGDVWEIGTTQAITWYRENIDQVKIELSTNSGSDWMNIASSVQASDQTYNWEVQNYLSQNCLVRISDVANPSFSDTSDIFSIVTKVKPIVLTPNGGEKLTLGQLYDVTWKLGSGKLLAPKVPSHKSGNTKGKFESLETAATSNIRILLSTDDGVSWAEIKNQIAVDSAKFTWTVSGEPSDKCFIKIVDINDASNFDLSDSAFVILDNKIPNILVSTNALDFGNVYYDSTEVKQINITNTGTAELQIQSTSFYQTSSAYKVTTFNQTIKPDSTRNVSISFKPTEIANYADTLYVYHNAVGNPAKIALTGSGIEVPKPIIKIAATSVTFDTTYIGSNNQKTITIDNEGTADLVINSITTDKAVFSPLESSFTLGAGLRHILTLNFAPTSDSGYSGTLTIQHNAISSPSTLSLIGKGKKHVPNIVLSSKEINFGVITIYTHTEVTLDINNSGTADLVVSNISSSNNSFATNLTNFVVQPNSSRAVTLTFSPINAAQYTGTLTIAHNAGAGVSTVSMAGAGYPVDVIVTRTISFGDITLSGNYRMVGLPGDSSISISKTVSGTQKNDWNAFYDNGVISSNQSDYLKEYDGSAKFTFKPGNGFWVVSKNGLTVSANVKPVPLAADSTYAIPLQSNWNIISNPFEKSTSWAKIKQLNSLTTHPLYKWNGQNYDQVSEMTTYEGFYFYNTVGLTSLKIPYDANGTLRKFFKSREEYQLGEKGFSIDCRQEGIEKSSVYAGFNSKSSNDVDDYDYFMPPADFGEVSLVLQNDSLSTDYKKLLVEQRKEIGEGTQFDFTARNSSKQQVKLSVNGIEFFPESETYLLDKQYNKFTNLKEKNIFTLPQQMGKRNYALLVGSQSFIQERKAAIIPTEYLLYQNFPNPFNPATTIAFGLPKESNVTLTLFNMLGEIVMQKELGIHSPGYHESLLDLRSKTSGVYFYAIHANALDGSKVFREVKKMMLLK